MRIVNLLAYVIHWFGKALILLFLWPYWIIDKSEVEGGTPTDIGVLVLNVLWLVFAGALIALIAAYWGGSLR